MRLGAIQTISILLKCNNNLSTMSPDMFRFCGVTYSSDTIVSYKAKEIYNYVDIETTL